MLTLNSKALKIGNKWLNPVNGSGPTPPSTTYYVTTSGTHGSVTASPTEGTTGTEVTLSNTPDTHYHFDSYTLTGATLKNANQFDIANSDVSVVGNFLEDTKYTVTVNQSTGGTISASPTIGYTGTEVTLSNTPATHYTFGSYNLIGATLKSANKFDIANSNVTVGATWVEDTKYSVTCTNDGNGTIAASPTSNYSGSTVTLSNTPNSGYEFDSYTLVSGTGASISGNTLTIGTSNVTVRGNFTQAGPSVNYDSYRLVITPIRNTYVTTGLVYPYSRYAKIVASDTMSAVNIKNLSRTATAGYIYITGNPIQLTSTELSRLNTSYGYTSAVNYGKGYTLILEGGNLSSLSLDINVTLATPANYNVGVQLLGVSGTATTPIAYKEVAAGNQSVTLSITDTPYIDYKYIYAGDGANGASALINVNQLTVTPTAAVSYNAQAIETHKLTSSEIYKLTANSTPYVMPDSVSSNSEQMVLECLLSSKPTSVSITERSTAMSQYRYSHGYTAEISGSIIYSSANGLISANGSSFRFAKVTGTVSTWPTTITVTATA
ncbi:MAG: hypothetical protein IIZ78_21715 [Clostridiales bacterium]|nr:hypothetical protein [Clostridiales bacterium]